MTSRTDVQHPFPRHDDDTDHDTEEHHEEEQDEDEAGDAIVVSAILSVVYWIYKRDTRVQ